MTARQWKALRDLSQEGTRTVLVVFAVAVGIAGFTAVLSAYAVLAREMNREYLATNPASATLRMDELDDAVDDALIAAVLADRTVADADARRIVSGRIKTEGGEWHNLRLFVAKDFRSIRIGKLQPEQGAWPPAAGEMLIERDAGAVARVRVGDSVIVKTARGSMHTLRVAGVVHDVGQAQARMENIVYGYVTPDTLAALGEAPYLDRLNILVASDRMNEPHVRSVAMAVKKLVESHGHTVHSVDVPTPGEHPHAHIMNLLFRVMSVFGFCVLALSGILVVNLVAAMMASQVRQIGVMKAIGGTRAQISAIYFSQTLLLGTTAILIGLPAGILFGRGLCRLMAVLLNFDIVHSMPPIWVYVLAAIAGWAVPVAAAAWPIWKGSRTSIRIALGDSGVSSDAFGTGRFDRFLAGIGGPLRPLLLALRNSFRRRARLALTLATLAAGGLFFLTGLNMRASFIETFNRFFAAKRFDVAASLDGMYPVESIERAVGNTPGVLRAESWMDTEGWLENDSAMIVGLPAPSALLKLDIVAGRDLKAGDTNAIVINTALAGKQSRFRVGSRATLRVESAQASVRVVGIVRERISPPSAYVPAGFLGEISGHAGMANSIRLVLGRTDRASIDGVKTVLEGKLAQEHVRLLSSSSQADTRFGFDQHMVMIYIFLAVVSAIIAAIGGLGLMTSMSLNVLERRREMGVMRAIGASPGMIWLIVVTEGVLVGVWSWALAALLAWPLSKFLGDLAGSRVFTDGLDFRFEVEGLLIWLAVSIFIGITASFVPAWNASRTTVREALSRA
jgi:putative ABC transport system permease protein